MKGKEYRMANFATFVSKTVIFFPQKWMNLISNQLNAASIKYFNWPSPVFERFQNGCNKVVIEPRVVQFWSEITLVISNRTRAARSFNFEITHMISAQIAPHSVQLPLWIIQPAGNLLRCVIIDNLPIVSNRAKSCSRSQYVSSLAFYRRKTDSQLNILEI